MELWVRTQDRTTLIRSYEIYISEQQNKYLIRAKRTSHILGSYETFERALEVLDGIQKILNHVFILDSKSIKSNSDIYEENGMILQDYSGNYEIRQLDTYVYQMPQE